MWYKYILPVYNLSFHYIEDLLKWAEVIYFNVAKCISLFFYG